MIVDLYLYVHYTQSNTQHTRTQTHAQSNTTHELKHNRHYGTIVFAWHPTLLSLAVFLVLQEAVRTYARPNYRSRMSEIAGDWARYLSANAERSAMRKRNLSGMLLSATALLLMAVGIGFVVISKHQVGLSSKPVSTHSKFGLVTVSLLFASVLRSMIRPCLFSDMGNMSDWISRILATALFILSYYTAYVIFGYPTGTLTQ